MEIYTVIWGSAGYDSDDQVVKAYAGVHGTYKTEASAQKALEECKQEFIDEVMNNPDFDEFDKASFKNNLEIYGSIEDGYFELDYEYAGAPVEIYIQITHSYVED